MVPIVREPARSESSCHGLPTNLPTELSWEAPNVWIVDQDLI